MELAIAEQKKTDDRLGDIVARIGLLAERQLNYLFDYQRNQSNARQQSSPLRLDELLVTTGHITREQLDDALGKQTGSGKKPGEVLIQEGYVKPDCVKRGLRIQQMLLSSAIQQEQDYRDTVLERRWIDLYCAKRS